MTISCQTPVMRGEANKGRTARRLPVACLRASSPPGPRLLLLDFFLLTASDVVPISIVAFSLSTALRDETPSDFRARRAAGTVASLEDISLKSVCIS